MPGISYQFFKNINSYLSLNCSINSPWHCEQVKSWQNKKKITAFHAFVTLSGVCWTFFFRLTYFLYKGDLKSGQIPLPLANFCTPTNCVFAVVQHTYCMWFCCLILNFSNYSYMYIVYYVRRHLWALYAPNLNTAPQYGTPDQVLKTMEPIGSRWFNCVPQGRL